MKVLNDFSSLPNYKEKNNYVFVKKLSTSLIGWHIRIYVFFYKYSKPVVLTKNQKICL